MVLNQNSRLDTPSDPDVLVDGAVVVERRRQRRRRLVDRLFGKCSDPNLIKPQDGVWVDPVTARWTAGPIDPAPLTTKAAAEA